MPDHIGKMFSKVQNGSDIRGVAVAGVDGEAVNITPAMGTSVLTMRDAFSSNVSDRLFHAL